MVAHIKTSLPPLGVATDNEGMNEGESWQSYSTRKDMRGPQTTYISWLFPVNRFYSSEKEKTEEKTKYGK